MVACADLGAETEEQGATAGNERAGLVLFDDLVEGASSASACPRNAFQRHHMIHPLLVQAPPDCAGLESSTLVATLCRILRTPALVKLPKGLLADYHRHVNMSAALHSHSCQQHPSGETIGSHIIMV